MSLELNPGVQVLRALKEQATSNPDGLEVGEIISLTHSSVIPMNVEPALKQLMEEQYVLFDTQNKKYRVATDSQKIGRTRLNQRVEALKKERPYLHLKDF